MKLSAIKMTAKIFFFFFFFSSDKALGRASHATIYVKCAGPGDLLQSRHQLRCNLINGRVAPFPFRGRKTL